MKRMLAVAVLLAAAAVVVALAYTAAARDRSYRAYLSQGAAALADDQTFGAIEAYSGAIALQPDSMLAHLRRGEAYQRRNELEAATNDFRRAADLDPSATHPLEALGDVGVALRSRGASPTFRTSLRYAPPPPSMTSVDVMRSPGFKASISFTSRT